MLCKRLRDGEISVFIVLRDVNQQYICHITKRLCIGYDLVGGDITVRLRENNLMTRCTLYKPNRL